MSYQAITFTNKSAGDTLAISWDYDLETEVHVYVDNLVVDRGLWEFTNSSLISFLAGFPAGSSGAVQRQTSDNVGGLLLGSAVFDYQAVNRINTRQFYAVQELRQENDRAFVAPLGSIGGTISVIPLGHFYKKDANGNLVDGGNAQDIVNAQANAAIATTQATLATTTVAAGTTNITNLITAADTTITTKIADATALFDSVTASYLTLSAPNILNKAIGGDWTANATTNLALMNTLLADSAANGTYVKIPRGTIPIDGRIVPPTAGAFTLEGGHFLIQDEDFGGFFRTAAPDDAMNDVVIDGLTLEFDINPATSLPYAGNGIVAKFRDSTLQGINILNYHGDQALLLALYDSTVDCERIWTDHLEGGTGIARILGGNNFSVRVRWGRGGDDLMQAVPALSGIMANLGVANGKYRLDAGETAARAAIAFTAPTQSMQMDNLEFNINCKTLPQHSTGGNAQSAVIENNGTGVMRNVVMKGHLDETLRRGTGNAVSGGVGFTGKVSRCELDFYIRHPDRVILNMEGGASGDPTYNVAKVTTNAAPHETGSTAIRVTGGTNNRIIPNIVANTAGPTVVVSGGAGLRIQDGSITGIAAGQSGIRVLTAATRNTITGMNLVGSGTAVSLQTGTVNDEVYGNDLGGQAVTLGSASTSPLNR